MSDAKAAPTWRSIAIVVLVAMTTLVVIDVALQRRVPPLNLREVEEAVADYRVSDPTTLVIGSSHARSFLEVDRVLRERGTGERVLPVPVEWGKFTSYEWVLNNRVRPFIDETDASGRLVRGRLQRFIMLTAWWDGCRQAGIEREWNIPSRGWRFSDFVTNVWSEGLTNYSRMYVSQRWTRLFGPSILVADRGHDRLPFAIADVVRGAKPDVDARRRAAQVAYSQRIVETCFDRINYPAEMEALERILDWAKGRGLETSLVLFPLAPSTLNEQGVARVVAPSEAAFRAVADRRGLRYVDLTYKIGLGDDDFRFDLDHLNPGGDAKFARYVLENDMRFLAEPVAASGQQTTQGPSPPAAP